jgi:hypothetical protein
MPHGDEGAAVHCSLACIMHQQLRHRKKNFREKCPEQNMLTHFLARGATNEGRGGGIKAIYKHLSKTRMEITT